MSFDICADTPGRTDGRLRQLPGACLRTYPAVSHACGRARRCPRSRQPRRPRTSGLRSAAELEDPPDPTARSWHSVAILCTVGLDLLPCARNARWPLRSLPCIPQGRTPRAISISSGDRGVPESLDPGVLQCQLFQLLRLKGGSTKTRHHRQFTDLRSNVSSFCFRSSPTPGHEDIDFPLPLAARKPKLNLPCLGNSRMWCLRIIIKHHILKHHILEIPTYRPSRLRGQNFDLSALPPAATTNLGVQGCGASGCGASKY